MKFFVRQRGEDVVRGPYSTEEMEASLKNEDGTISDTTFLMLDAGQTQQDLIQYRNYV